MQLGIYHEVRPGDDLRRTADQIATLGFSSLHAHFPEGCDESLARRLARACAESGLSVVAVSGYANLLRPDEAPMGSNLDQLADLIDLMPLLNCRRVVSWSGTFGPGLFDAHPDNRSPAGWEALRRSIEEIFPLLDDAEAILLLEPHAAHTLAEPAEIARFCTEFGSPYVRIVLDPPGLLTVEAWEEQAAAIPAAIAILAPYVGLVHLQDARLRGQRVELPGPGQGSLDYTLLMNTLRAAEIVVPTIVSQVSLDKAAVARRFVLDHSLM